MKLKYGFLYFKLADKVKTKQDIFYFNYRNLFPGLQISNRNEY